MTGANYRLGIYTGYCNNRYKKYVNAFPQQEIKAVYYQGKVVS